MRAIRFEHFGSPEQLQLQELRFPNLSPGEVLVEVHAAAINPSNVKNVSGNMENTTLPRTPGRDFAGIVVQGPENLIGAEVWGTGGDIGFTCDGSHAEYIVLPQDAIRVKPRNLSMEQAGSVGLTYVTAWLSIMDAAQLKVGETLLVIGATGGVGSAAMEIAKWQGARVLGTVRRKSDREQAQQFQADVVINLAVEQLRDAVFAATEGKGANVILDTVGGSMVEQCLEVLAQKGRLTEISAPAKEPRVSFDLRDFYHRESRLIGVDSHVQGVSGCAPILEALTSGFEAGALLAPSVIESYALEDAVKAYEQVLNRITTIKVVLTPKRS